MTERVGETEMDVRWLKRDDIRWRRWIRSEVNRVKERGRKSACKGRLGMEPEWRENVDGIETATTTVAADRKRQ